MDGELDTNGEPDKKVPAQADFRLIYSVAAVFIVGLVCCTFLAMHPDINANTVLTIGTMVTMAAGFMVQHFKTAQVEKKLDKNTQVTEDAKEEAKTVAAKTAIVAAGVAKEIASTALHATEAAVSEVKTAVNGRMDELLQAAKEAGHAAGMVEGIAQAEETQRKVEEQLHRHRLANDENVRVLKEELVKQLQELKCREEARSEREAKGSSPS